MGKRFFCLVCAAVLVIGSLFGVRAYAQSCKPVVASPAGGNFPAKTRVSHKPNPLVSAMFLVLAGVGIYLLGSLLFKLDSFRYILSILKNLLHRGGAAKE